MNKNGFTLIEILLSMVILSSVIFVGSLSFSVYSEKWQTGIGDFDQVYAESRNMLLMQKVFAGASNYIIKNEQEEVIYFFEGQSQQLAFVTNNPIFDPSTPAYVTFDIKTKSSGEQELVYSEFSFSNQLLLNTEQSLQKSASMILLTRDNLRFNFYGWATKEQRIAFYDDEDFSPVWNSAFNGEVSGMLPFAISIIWQDSEPVIFNLANDQAELLSYTNEKRNEV